MRMHRDRSCGYTEWPCWFTPDTTVKGTHYVLKNDGNPFQLKSLIPRHCPVRNPNPSLIPRLFLPPVLDCLQYAKMEGEGLRERVTCVTSGRREGGGARQRILKSFLKSWCYFTLIFIIPQAHEYQHTFNIHDCLTGHVI